MILCNLTEFNGIYRCLPKKYGFLGVYIPMRSKKVYFFVFLYTDAGYGEAVGEAVGEAKMRP